MNHYGFLSSTDSTLSLHRPVDQQWRLRGNRSIQGLQDICARFPSELHDYIVDFLHNDRASLCACRLTCKLWTASSTYHLFHNAGTIHVGRNNFLQFCELFANHPLGACIGRLNLKSHLSGHFKGGTDETFQFNEHLSRFTSLPRLKYLRLYYHYDDLRPSFYSALAQNFSSVTDLELSYMYFASFADVLRACSALPLLRRLALINVLWRGPSTSDREMYPVFGELPVVDLVVDYCYVDDALFCQWLASQPSIRRLALGRESSAALSAAILIPLCRTSHLPPLFIRSNFLPVSDAVKLPVSLIPALLERLRSRVIQRIVIFAGLRNPVDLDRLDWQRIASLLAGLESLRRVEFYFSAHETWALAAIDEKLRPRAYALRVANLKGRHCYSLGRFDR
ncbi:hypothetical protein GGX14DRAFT_654035 [Mycena pura]|uniref:F-box domain-containing protein n=1 Tax=Mycena pura TaxID=153505 RepID=A0AAD6V8U8_9AGAR|nr:hypothetical protein GGX14DRAFT_654035 [Mycena pura]